LWPGPIAAVRSGSVSAERYVSTLLDRVERLTSLNAFITMGADGALAAAHTFDAMRACGDQLPPLAGLVIVVKDNINLQGLTTSSGTVALKNARPRIPGGSSGGTVAAIAARIVPSGLGTDTELPRGSRPRSPVSPEWGRRSETAAPSVAITTKTR
jgi:mandelamide amidase